MSFSKNRKRSGVVLAGVTTASVAASAASQGMVRALPQNSVAANLANNISGEAAKGAGSGILDVLKKNYGWVLVALGIVALAGFIFYKIKNQGLETDETKNIYLKNENENKNVGRREDEYGMCSPFCEEESGNFAKIMKNPLTLLENCCGKEFLGIEGVQIELTVEQLLKILNNDSKEKFEKAMKNNSKNKITIEICTVNEEGNLDVYVKEFDQLFETKYVSSENIDGLIGFFNEVFKKVSNDNKKNYRFKLEKEDVDNVSIKLIENKENGKQLGDSFTIELKEDEDENFVVKNEKGLNSLILKYQYENKEVNIFDEFFFERANGVTYYKDSCFDFRKDLNFIEGLEVELSSNTLRRILEDDSYCDLPDEVEDYLNEKENVKIVLSSPDCTFGLKFALCNEKGDLFKYDLKTRSVDGNVNKFIKFYNYILEEAYKQNKLDFKVLLEKKGNGKIVVKHGSREYEFNRNKNLMDILREIENDVKNIITKGFKNIIGFDKGASLVKI